MHRPPTSNFPPPQPFLLSVLPLILAPDPQPLPPLLLSDPARQAIHYLGLKAEDAAYWTTGTRDEAVVDKRRELVEAGNVGDLVLGDPHYHCDLEETKCIIPLSLPHSLRAEDESLGVVLLWEDELPPLSATAADAVAAAAENGDDEDDTRPGWTFLELQSLSQKPADIEVVASNGRRRPSWYPTLKEAVDATAFQPALSLPPHLARRDSPPELLEFQRNSPHLGSRDSPPYPPTESASVVPSFAPPPEEDEEGGAAGGGKKKKKTAAEMEDGNGAATPGAYGTAEDFWDGWSEDEEGGAEEGAGGAGEAPQDEDDDAGYWDSYGAADSQIGEEEDDDVRTVEATPTLAQKENEPPSPAKSVTRDRSATITPHTPGAVASPTLASASAYSPDPAAPSSPPVPSSSLAPPLPKEQLYFSTNLPPLSPRHFGISPTQPDPDRFLSFTSPTASVYSTTTPRVGDEMATFSSLPPTTPQVQQHAGGGGGHARRPSDVSKALPSAPAFPVKPRSAGAGGENSAPTTPAQAAFPSSSSAHQSTSPRRPSPSRKATLSPKLGPTAAAAAKALPPAPSQISLAPPLHPSSSDAASTSPPKQNGTLSPSSASSPHGHNKLRKGPPAPLSPASLAATTTHTSAIPLSPRSPRTPSSATSAAGGAGAEKPTPPRPGSTYFPLRSPTNATVPLPSPSALGPGPGPGPRPSVAPPALPNPSSWRASAPPPSSPPAIDLRQRGRFGSLDSLATSVAPSSASTAAPTFERAGRGSVSSVGSDGTSASAVSISSGVLRMFQGLHQKRGSVDSGRSEATVDGSLKGLPNGHSTAHSTSTLGAEEREELVGAEEAEAGGDDEALRFALAGVWALYSRGAKTGAERADRRRRWERVAGEVVRS
ncbi:hypothetical protein JCM6882_009742 [Rhodosporidiobolus microsporus]